MAESDAIYNGSSLDVLRYTGPPEIEDRTLWQFTIGEPFATLDRPAVIDLADSLLSSAMGIEWTQSAARRRCLGELPPRPLPAPASA